MEEIGRRTGRAIIYSGKRCTTDLAKPYAFNQEYADERKKEDKESRSQAVRKADVLRTYGTDDPAEWDFNVTGLDAALAQVKLGKAACHVLAMTESAPTLCTGSLEWQESGSYRSSSAPPGAEEL